MKDGWYRLVLETADGDVETGLKGALVVMHKAAREIVQSGWWVQEGPLRFVPRQVLAYRLEIVND